MAWGGALCSIYFAAGLNNPVGGFAKLAKFLGIILLQAHGEICFAAFGNLFSFFAFLKFRLNPLRTRFELLY